MGATQLWVTRHVPPFFRSLSTERPPFLPTFTQWPPIFNKLLVTERHWHIFVTQRPLIFTFNRQTSDNFGKKLGFFENFDKFDEMLRNFWPFWPWKPLVLMHFIERLPIFVRFVTERPPFLMHFVTKRPLHLRCLVALVRHFHMWVPPGLFINTICTELESPHLVMYNSLTSIWFGLCTVGLLQSEFTGFIFCASYGLSWAWKLKKKGMGWGHRHQEVTSPLKVSEEKKKSRKQEVFAGIGVSAAPRPPRYLCPPLMIYPALPLKKGNCPFCRLTWRGVKLYLQMFP